MNFNSILNAAESDHAHEARVLTRMQVENKQLEDRLKSIGGTAPEKLNVAESNSDKIAQELSHKIKLLENIAAKSKDSQASDTGKQSQPSKKLTADERVKARKRNKS